MKPIPFSTNIFKAAIVIGSLFISSAALACSAMGPNTHVGQITAVDSGSRTFTIQDAETNKPITFAASDKMMLTLAPTNHQVVVRYNGENGKLIATSVE